MCPDQYCRPAPSNSTSEPWRPALDLTAWAGPSFHASGSRSRGLLRAGLIEPNGRSATTIDTWRRCGNHATQQHQVVDSHRDSGLQTRRRIAALSRLREHRNTGLVEDLRRHACRNAVAGIAASAPSPSSTAMNGDAPGAAVPPGRRCRRGRGVVSGLARRQHAPIPRGRQEISRVLAAGPPNHCDGNTLWRAKLSFG